nr:unnamed protein product [Callosobruchus chinensis]
MRSREGQRDSSVTRP